MTLNRILNQLLNIKSAAIDDARFSENTQGVLSLRVRVHINRKKRYRCPVCGRKCSVYDHAYGESVWRSMDFGPVSVYLLCCVPRISCPKHGVVTAAMPLAKQGSRFATGFAYSAA